MPEQLTPKSEKIDNPQKAQAKKILQQILDTTIDIDSIENPEKYIEGVFNAFISQTEELVKLYKQEHRSEISPDEDIRNLEDKALADVGFTGVSKTLDRILEIREIVSNKIPNMVKRYTSDIITPPDQDSGIIAGSRLGFDEKELIPRFKTLLFILLADCGLSEDQIKVTIGSVDKNMIREEPYAMVEVSDLNRTIFVCDEEGNRTDIFDMKHKMCQEEGAHGLALLTKQEREEFGKMYPGSHVAIRFSPDWSDRIYNAVTNDFDIKTKKSKPVKRPRTFEVLPRADKDGFYTDEKGVRWGSVFAIIKEIAIGLRDNKKFIELFLKFPSIKIISSPKTVNAYNIEEVKNEMKKIPELAAFFRRTEKDGFYEDENGVRWGSAFAIAKEISPGLDQNKNFKEILVTLSSIKVLSYTQIADAYSIEQVKFVMQKHPELSVYFRRAEKDCFYTDENGVRWGSLNALAREISPGLDQNKIFKEILATLPSIKIFSGRKIADAYDLEQVKVVMQNHREISAFFRKAENDGLYTDENGIIWGSVYAIGKEISPGLEQNKIFKEVLATLPSIKILSGSQTADSYNIEQVKQAILNEPKLSHYHDKI